ncbi:hypothetical protein EV201_2112 [Ancylomarina subtilis]|uniref:DUF5689 domain-containing protein n=1 Tax=Ancylomarina subtilis TaxID=1639035 RepID=A0A4Q7VMD8_9BACT|nr:DUF5689 domain-containing protein [Ancylomarina subtilis]RZT97442.1 hypothetical protein EV201_2112 [Ancylomarina subtilis]
MKNISLSIIVALMGLLFLNSCIDDDYAEPTIVEPTFEIPAEASLISIADLKSIYTNAIPSTGKYLKADEFLTVEEDVYISGYVISDDKEGNFYKNIVIQGDLEGNSQGINISVGESSLFTSFAQGQKIFVKCKGLTLGKYGNEVQLGGSFYFYKYRDQEKFKEYRLAPIPSPSIDAHIFKDKYPVAMTPAVRTIAELKSNSNYKFTLVTVNNVQLNNPGETWGVIGPEHNAAFPFKTTIELNDANGNNLPLFTSNYSKFAHLITPEGSGSVTGVLSYHNGEPQFVINRLDDVQLTGDRFGTNSGEYSGTLTQVDNFDVDFSNLTDNASIGLTGWHSIKEKGTRDWISKVYNTDVYAQASGYKSNDEEIISWLISPAVSVSVQKQLSLKTAKAYWEHLGDNQPLEILYADDFDGSNYKTANWQTLDVTIAQKTDGDHTWISSGNVALPVIAGKHISIAFKYTGSKTETTTYRLDDIKVTE